MQIIMRDMAHNAIDNIFEYVANYSVKNAMDTIDGIYEHIYYLEDFPYIGRCVDEIPGKCFRELIYRKTKKSVYRIIYYVSEKNEKIYINNIINCKQDFKTFLKLHNYFKNYYIF